MLIVLRTIYGIMRRKEGLIMIQRKKALCAASASALAALGGLYGLYRYAFYSPRGAQNDDHHISTNPQMQVYREEISRAIDALNALPCERVYITSADGLPRHALARFQRRGGDLPLYGLRAAAH